MLITLTVLMRQSTEIPAIGTMSDLVELVSTHVRNRYLGTELIQVSGGCADSESPIEITFVIRTTVPERVPLADQGAIVMRSLRQTIHTGYAGLNAGIVSFGWTEE